MLLRTKFFAPLRHTSVFSQRHLSLGRFFSTNNEEYHNEVRNALAQLRTESGQSLDELKMIHSMGIDQDKGIISIKLNLTKDYRKAKSLIQKKLQE